MAANAKKGKTGKNDGEKKGAEDGEETKTTNDAAEEPPSEPVDVPEPCVVFTEPVYEEPILTQLIVERYICIWVAVTARYRTARPR